MTKTCEHCGMEYKTDQRVRVAEGAGEMTKIDPVKVNEHFDKWKADYCLRNKIDHEFLFVGCRDAYLAGYALASHAPNEAITAESLAQQFHETYERLAPQFGYETRKESAKPWSEVPEKNKRLMIAVCRELASEATAQPKPLASYLSQTYDFSTQDDAVKAMAMGKEIADGIKAEIEHNDH